MAHYRKIYPRLYADRAFFALSAPPPNAQFLWLYLLTGPHTTSIPGLSAVGEAAMAEALGWTLEDFRRAFAEISAQGMAEADWKARVVWLPGAIAENPPESPNAVRGWADHGQHVPDCPLRRKALSELRRHTEAKGEAWANAFREGFPEAFPEGSVEVSPKPRSNQEQEQEQEQQKTKKGSNDPSACGGRGGPVGGQPEVGTSAATEPSPVEGIGRGTAAARKAPRVRAPKPDAKPEHGAFKAGWAAAWKARQGFDFPWRPGADDKHVKWILDQMENRDATAALAVARGFFDDEDPWPEAGGYTLGQFVSRFARYRGRLGTSGASASKDVGTDWDHPFVLEILADVPAVQTTRSEVA